MSLFTPAQRLEWAKMRLRRGSICHWLHSFGPHYAVILNLEWPPVDGRVWFSVATSKTHKFSSFVSDEVIRIKAGTYKCLPRETVINLRKVYDSQLDVIVQQPQFSIEDDELSSEHIDAMDRALRNSETVDDWVLDLVVRR